MRHIEQLTPEQHAKEQAKPIETLACCCCGEAYSGRQWWNQDNGFGLGNCCTKYFISDCVSDVSHSYGVPGIHFLLPPSPGDRRTVFFGIDELRETAEQQIERGFNVEYWNEVLKAI